MQLALRQCLETRWIAIHHGDFGGTRDPFGPTKRMAAKHYASTQQRVPLLNVRESLN
jgi:hypothetical protein